MFGFLFGGRWDDLKQSVFEDKIDLIEDEIRDISREIEDLKYELEVNESIWRNSSEYLFDLKAQYDKDGNDDFYYSARQNAQSQLADCGLEINKIKKQIRQKKRELEEKKRELELVKAEKKRAYDKLELEKMDIENDIERTKRELEKLSDEKELIEYEIEEDKREITENIRSLNDPFDPPSDHERNEIESQINTRKENIDFCERRLREIENEIRSHRNDLKDLKESLNDVKAAMR